jgi:hypothetical protein
MADSPTDDFFPAPIATDEDFIPAPVAQEDEDFIPATYTPEQTVTEALAGIDGYSAAVQTASEYGDNPTLRPLFVKALANRQKKQALKTPEESLNDVAKIALALPGVAGRTLYSVVTESIPAVANNVRSLFAGNPAEQLQAAGEAGSAIVGAVGSTYELARKAVENVSDSVTFSKPSLSRGLDILRNPLLVAQSAKVTPQSDEEYERRADADISGVQNLKAAAEGRFLPGGIREKAAALGLPIRPEVSENLQVAYDPLNWIPFGGGFVVGKVGNAFGLGVRTADGVEVVAKGLQKISDVENAAETVGVLRRGVGATVSGAGQRVVRASDSPAVVGTIAGATALAGGAEPITAMLATLIGAGTVRGAGPVADVLKSSGRTLVRVGDQIAGKASLGPMGRFAESAVNFVKPSIVEGGQTGLALGLPFALSARDEQDVADVLGSSAAFGVGGHLVGQVLGAGNRYFSIDSAFRDATAKAPDSAYERPEFSYYSQDQGNVVEAKSKQVFDTLSNKGAQTVEALKKLFVKPDANGIKTEIYILDRATSDALAKQYAGSEQGRAGFSVEIPDQKRRLVVINADSNGGISLGHEVGHAFYASLPYAQKKALLDAVSKTIRPDDFAQLKTRYEDLFNQKRNEDGSYTPVPEAERVKISDDYAAQEYIAENFSAYLNGVPIEKFGTPRGLADRIRVSIGAVLEKGGARRLTTDNSAAVRTELGYKPSAALAELYQNFIEARQLDNTTVATINGEAAPIDVTLPPVEGPADRATNAPIAPVSANAPTSPLGNIREVEAKPVVPGFKKGDPIGEIRDKDGMLIAEDAKVLRKNEDGTYEIEFIDPDTGKRLIATTDEASLVSPISPGKVDPNKTVFPASPVTPQTPFFAATAPTAPTAPTPPTAATTVAPKQVENVARPQSSVATPNLRPGAAAKFAAKAPDALHSQNRKVIEDLMLAPRAEIPAVETDYYAAASPVQSPDAIVRAAQRKAADALEKSGESNPFRATFQKLFVPYRWSSYKLDAATNARLYGEGAPRQPGGIYGMSVDKVGQNLDLLRGLAKETPAIAETLSNFGVSQDYLASAALVSDFRTYLDNQAHGYGGDGKKLLLPADTRPGTITAQDPNFVPTALPANKRQLFNLLLNLEQQATRTPGMEFSARFAKQNGIDPLTVGFDDKGRPLTDNNALRAALLRNNFDPRLLNSAVENLPTENFTSAIKVRPDVALPAADVAITQAGFMPETGFPRRPQGNDETRSVAAQYTQKAGIQAAPHDTYAPVNETTLKRIADFYENAKNEPENPEVQKAYRALSEETRAQYDEMLANGIEIEPYEGKGEPYANSAAMLADVRDNKHLYFFLTKNAFGEGADVGNNVLLEKSGIKINGQDLLYNDLFRAVHDYFGHTAEGFEFGPRGEYNAYLAHSRMFSDEAKPALAAETLAQNAWVNFGPQLRRADGSLPKAGDADFVPIAKRRFADQKNTVVPPELLQTADPQAAFMPEDSQLEGFGESMREKMRAKMAKVEPTGYQEGDKFELPSGKVVEFVSDLLPKKGGARDGAQMAYVRFEDGMESSVYADDLTKYYGPGATFMPETQFDAPKKLPDAIRNKTLTLVHRGAAGLSELDPAKFGFSRITPRSELSGEPRVYFYVKGFENKGDPSQLRGNKYEIPVSGKRIYDGDTDALDWTQDVNRQRADIMLKDAGYVGLIRTRGEGKDLFKQVEIFEKVSVDGTPVSKTDVRTPRSRLETPEGRAVDAQLRKKYGSTGAYFDRLEEYEKTGNVRFMPEGKRRVEEAAIRFDGEIFTGAKHYDAFERMQEQGFVDEGATTDDVPSSAFGFVDNKGKFLTRVEAAKLAEASGQLSAEGIRKSIWNLPEGRALEADGFEMNRRFMPEATLDQVKDQIVVEKKKGTSVPKTFGQRYEDQAGFAEAVPLTFEAKKDGSVVYSNKEPKILTRPYDFFDTALTRELEIDPEDMASLKTKLNNLILSEVKAGALETRLTDGEKAAMDKMVDAYSQRAVDDFGRYADDPQVKGAAGWYSDIAEFFKKIIPNKENRTKLLEFLGGTSPNTDVETNFLYALDLYNRYKKGELDGYRDRHNSLVANFDSLASTYAEQVPVLSESGKPKTAGGQPVLKWQLKEGLEKQYRKDYYEALLKDGVKPAPARMRAKNFSEGNLWNLLQLQNDVAPRRAGGGKYGMHSDRILQIMNNEWRDKTDAPKAPNFTENLAGLSTRATIDVWAARWLRRLGYDGITKEPWRLLPMMEQGVGNADFFLGQQIFEKTTKRINEELGDKLGRNINPDDLQAIMWFAEKREWARRGWSVFEDLGDFRNYTDRLTPNEGGTFYLADVTLNRSSIDFLRTLSGVELKGATLSALARENLKELNNSQRVLANEMLRTKPRPKILENHTKKVLAAEAKVGQKVNTSDYR